MIVGIITPRMELKNRFRLNIENGMRFRQIPRRAEVLRRKLPSPKLSRKPLADNWSNISSQSANPKKGIKMPNIPRNRDTKPRRRSDIRSAIIINAPLKTLSANGEGSANSMICIVVKAGS